MKQEIPPNNLKVAPGIKNEIGKIKAYEKTHGQGSWGKKLETEKQNGENRDTEQKKEVLRQLAEKKLSREETERRQQQEALEKLEEVLKIKEEKYLKLVGEQKKINIFRKIAGLVGLNELTREVAEAKEKYNQIRISLGNKMYEVKKEELIAEGKNKEEIDAKLADYNEEIFQKLVAERSIALSSKRIEIAGEMYPKKIRLYDTVLAKTLPIRKVGLEYLKKGATGALALLKATGNYGPNLIDRRGKKPENAKEMTKDGDAKIEEAKKLKKDAESEKDSSKKEEMLQQAKDLKKEGKDLKDTAKGQIIYQYKLGQLIRTSAIFTAGGIWIAATGGVGAATMAGTGIAKAAGLLGIRTARSVGIGLGGATGLAHNEKVLQTKLDKYKTEKENLTEAFRNSGQTDIIKYGELLKDIERKEQKARILANTMKVVVVGLMTYANIASGSGKIGNFDTGIGQNWDQSMLKGVENLTEGTKNLAENIAEGMQNDGMQNIFNGSADKDTDDLIPKENTVKEVVKAGKYEKVNYSTSGLLGAKEEGGINTSREHPFIKQLPSNEVPKKIDYSTSGLLGVKEEGGIGAPREHTFIKPLSPNEIPEKIDYSTNGLLGIKEEAGISAPREHPFIKPLPSNEIPEKMTYSTDELLRAKEGAVNMGPTEKNAFIKPVEENSTPKTGTTPTEKLNTANPDEKIIEAKEKITITTEVSEKGSIETVRNLKAQLEREYKDISTAPENVQHILKTDAVALTKEWGMFDPSKPDESAMMLKGSTITVDKSGAVTLHNLGKGDTILSGEGAKVYDGKMFNSDEAPRPTGNTEPKLNPESEPVSEEEEKELTRRLEEEIAKRENGNPTGPNGEDEVFPDESELKNYDQYGNEIPKGSPINPADVPEKKTEYWWNKTPNRGEGNTANTGGMATSNGPMDTTKYGTGYRSPDITGGRNPDNPIPAPENPPTKIEIPPEVLEKEFKKEVDNIFGRHLFGSPISNGMKSEAWLDLKDATITVDKNGVLTLHDVTKDVTVENAGDITTRNTLKRLTEFIEKENIKPDSTDSVESYLKKIAESNIRAGRTR